MHDSRGVRPPPFPPSRSLLPELTAAVKANHPYQECEVIALPILGGSPTYIKWLLDNTKGAQAAS